MGVRKPIAWAAAGLLGFVAVSLALFVASNRTARQVAQMLFVPFDAQEDRVERLIASEELLLALTPELRRLSRSVANLKLPDAAGRGLLAAQLEVRDLAREGSLELEAELPNVAARELHWELATDPRRRPSARVALWQPLFAEIDYFEFANFYFIAGEFADAERQRWTSRVGFRGLARTRVGKWWGLKATQQLTWAPGPTAAGGQPVWQIVGWDQESLKHYEVAAPLFVESLAAAIPDVATRERARTSLHEQMIVRLATDPEYRPAILPIFDHYSTDRHPGISVVDIDRDGWDDLYFMNQWGRNLLLRNQGNGTFVDVAAEYGLDLIDHCSSAVFADFDNDGDSDVFVGRTLVPSLYLERVDGRYLERTAKRIEGGLPSLVSALAAADYNGDGLLDVYFSTYAADLVIRNINHLVAVPPEPGTERLLVDFLPADQARELFLRNEREGHQMLARVGPPNVLLVNRGERFERSPATETLAVWRNSFQSTWGDYDDDGDPDLYVTNDFSANHLFRNDGAERFVDVTTETETADVGFGMGAAWGDYDNDGRQDLYVTNMYSKAGQRITGELGDLVDPRFRKLASGNSLFHNRGPAQPWPKISGLEPPSLQVEMAGWAWGGQFLDVNNDGYLDIFATNGYYTAPREIAADVDL